MRFFFPNDSCVHTNVRIHHMDSNKTQKEKAGRELLKNEMSYFERIQEATSHEITAVWSCTSHLQSHPRTRCAGKKE